jgi:purine-nucleoside phosphorylase
MNTLNYLDRLNRAAQFLQPFAPPELTWAVTLGSGLGGFSQRLQSAVTIPFADIPGFPQATVKGHAGNLVLGRLNNLGIAVMEGRFHLYEGHDPSSVVLPARVLMKLGVQSFFLTNAAGGINASFTPGDLMLIEDHLNLLGANPLKGPNFEEFGPRFPPMTNAYDPELRKICSDSARNLGLLVRRGVYAALPGPNYETQAEIRMLKILGADAVGMSTVPEVLAIRHASRRVVAVSLITNATTADAPPSHKEVVDVAASRRDDLHRLIEMVISQPG